MEDERRQRRDRRLGTLFAWLLWIMAAVWLAAGLLYAKLPPLPILFLGTRWLLIGAAVLAAAGFVVRRVPLKFGLWLVSFVYAGMLLYNLFGPRNGWLAPFAIHDTYGHIGIPNAHGFHWSHPEFNVEYTFDERGWRLTPPPQGPSRGTIVVLGCSYAFGIGVEDDETFTAVLAREHWPNYRLLNHSFPGWGTTESLVVLQDEVLADPKPAAIVYCWIDNHEKRNWLRQSWHKNKLAWGGRMLRWELVDGKLEYLGLTDPAVATADESPETTAKEEALSLALVKRMQALCDEHGVPFYVVAMNQWYSGTAATPDRLAAEGIAVIDVRSQPADFFDKDTHPRPQWHRDTAAAIARDGRLRAFGAR